MTGIQLAGLVRSRKRGLPCDPVIWSPSPPRSDSPTSVHTQTQTDTHTAPEPHNRNRPAVVLDMQCSVIPLVRIPRASSHRNSHASLTLLLFSSPFADHFLFHPNRLLIVCPLSPFPTSLPSSLPPTHQTKEGPTCIFKVSAHLFISYLVPIISPHFAQQASCCRTHIVTPALSHFYAAASR